MVEKVIDIRSPKSTGTNPEIKREVQMTSYRADSFVKKRGYGKRILFSILGILIIVILVFGYFSLSRARIEIQPTTQIIESRDEIIISSQVTEPDLQNKIIPGKIAEESLSVEQEFQVSGKTTKEARSKGTIEVYNAYSTAPQALVANTRFISAEGKLFRLVGSITVPGGTYDAKSKLIPGSIKVEVVAAEPGSEYDIGPSTFSIPGFSGTAKYTSFYGKSSSSMTGGSVTEVFQVAQADIDEAEKVLTDKLIAEGKDLLTKKLAVDSILLEDSLVREDITITHSAKKGDEVQSFTSKAQGKLKVIVFKQSDLSALAKKFIESSMPEEAISDDGFWGSYQIQDSSFKIDYNIKSIDWDTEKSTIDLSFSAKIYQSIKEDVFKVAILGKSSQEVSTLLGDQAQIGKSKVDLSPFWVKSVPRNPSKVQITLDLED